MPGPHPLIEQLAREHAEHLRWLQRRTHGRLAPDEAEDVLQAAYAKAMRVMADAEESGGPRFDSADKARAWLRTIAANLAVDDDRHRHGRRERQPMPSMRARVAALLHTPGRDAGIDVETDALNTVEREHHGRVIRRALEGLAPEHRQVLRLRYADNLEPAAIMVLENISARQWDGRHSRALKAFADALGRLHVDPECRRTRRLLRRSPVALLQAGGGDRTARSHVEGCLACGAFARSTRAALATLPLPLAIESWRYDVLEYLGAGRRTAGEAAVGRPAPAASADASTALAGVLTAAVLTAVAVTSVIAVDRSGAARTNPLPAKPPANESRSASIAEGGTSARWADHGTPSRRGLERAARTLATRRRSAGTRRRPLGSAGAGLRPVAAGLLRAGSPAPGAPSSAGAAPGAPSSAGAAPGAPSSAGGRSGP